MSWEYWVCPGCGEWIPDEYGAVRPHLLHLLVDWWRTSVMHESDDVTWQRLAHRRLCGGTDFAYHKEIESSPCWTKRKET